MAGRPCLHPPALGLSSRSPLYSQSVQDSAYLVMVPHVCPDTPPLSRNPIFLYMEDAFRRPLPFASDVAVDVEPVWDLQGRRHGRPRFAILRMAALGRRIQRGRSGGTRRAPGLAERAVHAPPKRMHSAGSGEAIRLRSGRASPSRRSVRGLRIRAQTCRERSSMTSFPYKAPAVSPARSKRANARRNPRAAWGADPYPRSMQEDRRGVAATFREASAAPGRIVARGTSDNAAITGGT